MLETSKDLLFITLAFCALLFTGFSCWLLFYFISIVRNAYTVTKTIKQKIDMVDEVLKTLKDKISSSANYIALLVNAVEKIVEHVQNKKTTRRAKKKAKVVEE